MKTWFWVVFRLDGVEGVTSGMRHDSCPTRRYDDPDSAMDEARRLAGQFRGIKFGVAKVEGYAVIEEPAPTVVTLTDPEDVPF